jgi:hypothetical protein
MNATTDIWDLFECLKCYKAIMQREGKTANIYINVSTGSKIASIAGTLACMIWKGTPYYTHIDYDNTRKDPSNGLPDEKDYLNSSTSCMLTFETIMIYKKSANPKFFSDSFKR